MDDIMDIKLVHKVKKLFLKTILKNIFAKTVFLFVGISLSFGVWCFAEGHTLRIVLEQAHHAAAILVILHMVVGAMIGVAMDRILYKRMLERIGRGNQWLEGSLILGYLVGFYEFHISPKYIKQQKGENT